MRKWGVALAVVGLLAVGANAQDLKFVPVDTTRNLAAPVPVYGTLVQRKSFFGRVGDSLKSISPFHAKTLPLPPGPSMPLGGMIGKAAAVATSPTAGISASAK